MKAVIQPSKLRGEIIVPPSKSLTHRALVAAALSEGISIINNPLICDDTHATINGLRNLGIDIQKKGRDLHVTGNKGIFKKRKETVHINCQESGTTLRFLTALAGISGNHVIMEGSKRLTGRPMGPLIKALRQLGIDVIANKNNFLPLEILASKIKKSEVSVEKGVSSQFVSSLLFISPLLPSGLKIKFERPVSRPYIDLTLEMMDKFGINIKKDSSHNELNINPQRYKATDCQIDGDYSSASYFLAAGVMNNSNIKINGLNSNSKQGDKIFIEILKKMRTYSHLKSISINMSNYPDLVPALAVVASFAKGRSRISGIGHLKYKESDRITAISRNLAFMGIKNQKSEDCLKIEGGKPKGAPIRSFNDHRIAMAFTIAALNASGISVIDNIECVMKSYPAFFEDILKIGGKVRIEP